MNFSDKQKEIVYSKENNIVVIANAAAGKAQPNDTLIPTPNGYKTIGELVPGDEVFNRYGKPEKILQIFPQGKQQIYEVEFADGRITECCGEHLWSYDNCHDGFTTKTLKEMYDKGWSKLDNRGHKAYKYRIPVLRKPVLYPEQEYDIDPYIIGAFIGDGCCTEEDLTLSSSDEWLIEKIANIEGFEYKKRSVKNYSWDFYKNNQRVRTKEYFKNYLKEICCYCQEKSIPKKYLIGSSEQRLRLLQGLMDTDGTVGDGKNSPRYCTNSLKLAEDVLELIRSLGFYGKIHTNDRRHAGKNIEYSVNIFTGNEHVFEIVSLPKKVEKALTFKNKKQRTNHNFVSIVDIRKTEKYKEMTCILVDHPEHLYLTNNFTVTHNTHCLAGRVRYLLDNGANPDKMVLMTFTNTAAEEMSQRIGNHNGMYIGTIHGYANQLLLRFGIDTSDLISSENFDELFEMALDNPHCAKEIDYLLVDEAQDLTELEYQFIFDILKPKSFFVVGDHRQCQPVGTKVLLRNNIVKNIEDVEVGDSIVYYVPSGGRCCGLSDKPGNSIVKKVEKIESHMTTEPIITIKTERGKQSSYTPGHRTYVRLHNNANKHAVYLMCDKNYRFRIGKISLGTETVHKNVSWRAKMVSEGCEKIWLLKIFNTDHEARVEEAKLSYQYGIPQICWQTKKVTWTKEDIDYIYQNLSTKENAKKCLQDFGLNILYPLFDNSISWMKSNNFCGNGPVLIYANNIIPEYMSALCYDFNGNNHSHKCYELITEKKLKTGENNLVYSLQTESGNYVADGIVTHNSIYQFRGARPDLFLSLSDREDTKTYNLDENYRNGFEILDFARRIIDKVGFKYIDKSIAKCGHHAKVVERTYNLDEIYRLIKTREEKVPYGDWFILTRYNSHLDEIYQFLKEKGIPCETFKRSDMNNAEMAVTLNNNTVKVLTIHAAKGLEAKNVIVVGAKYYSDEEKRISYVAATRAKNNLLWYKVATKKAPAKKITSWE